MRKPELFDAWDCTLPVVPPRSLLYALPPVGIGTPMVESLSGYIGRLADAHAVSVGDLVGRVLSPLAGTPLVTVGQFMKQHRAGSHGFHAQASALNNSGDMAKQWITALERATRQTTLRFLTLSPFAGVLSRQQVSRKKRAWCAHCYDDWRHRGAIIYEPLLWAIGLVTRCPRHDSPLLEHCPHCGRQSRPLTVYSRPGHCAQCQVWLGSPVAEMAPETRPRVTPALDLELWRAQAIGDLLAMSPSLPETSLHTILLTNLQACVDAVADGNVDALADACQVSRAAFRSHLCGRGVPTIAILVRLGFRLGVPLTTFLQSPTLEATRQWERAQHVVPRERRGHAYRSAEDVRRVLLQATQEQPVPSLSEIAKRVGYKGPEHLYRVDRELCKQLAAKYRRSGRSHQWRKPGAYRISEHVDLQQVLQDALAQERPPSLHSIAGSLGYANDGYLRQKFPDLCRALGQKHATRERDRRVAMERALSDALFSDPVPPLKHVGRQLGYANAFPLQRHFPTQCEQLQARRREQRTQQILTMRRQLQAWQLEVPAVSPSVASRRLGISSTTLQKLCPEESAVLGAQYLRWRHEASQLRKAQLFAEVREIVHSLREHGQYPSFLRVVSLLRPTTLREWKTLHAAIKVARETIERH